MELKTKLDRQKIEKLTDRLLSERQNNLKQILDIEHRLETVCELNGVEFLNDSKATDISATRYSLQCMEQSVIWMLSCEMRYADLAQLKDLVRDKVKAIVYVGREDAELVEEFIDGVDLIMQSDDLEEALAHAKELATEGDTVLFSPASPTGVQFEDYRARGEAFRALLK